MGTGLMLAGAVVAPLVLGVLVDGALRTSPAFLIIGLSIGMIAAVSAAYVRFKRFL